MSLDALPHKTFRFDPVAAAEMYAASARISRENAARLGRFDHLQRAALLRQAEIHTCIARKLLGRSPDASGSSLRDPGPSVVRVEEQ